MQRKPVDATYDAYTKAKPHLMDELPDRTPVHLLVAFSLGDLRRMDEVRLAEKLISGALGKSAGDAAPDPTPTPHSLPRAEGLWSGADDFDSR